jgi:glycosyltransferase involved in cell wall biosynthesis
MTSSNHAPAPGQPLVSIIVPVYNNAEHFPECLESILAQTYRNWDCTIVNNCSTDGSAQIARRYAARESRIRVIDNDKHLKVVANHNWALRQISAGSKYCKMIFADDWVFPRCLEDMVAVAERHPGAGVIGAYGLQGVEVNVKWSGLPYGEHLLPGREIVRRYFLDRVYVFGTLHSIMLRSELVRSRVSFLNESNLHADREVCLDLLRACDFAFVYQILTYTRERPGSLTDFSRKMNTMMPSELYEVVTYGRDFLDEQEYQIQLKIRLSEYYNYLAVSAMRGRRDTAFWELHKRKFADCGLKFSHPRLAGAVLARIARAVLRPGETFERLSRRSGPLPHGEQLLRRPKS